MNKAERIERLGTYLAKYNKRVLANETDVLEGEVWTLLDFLASIGAVWVCEDQHYEYSQNPYPKDVNLAEEDSKAYYDGLQQAAFWLGVNAQAGLMVETGWRKVERA